MEIFWGLDKFKKLDNAVVTMGTFDGIHLGHQEIIKDIVQSAKINNAKSVVITFDPHPRKVLQPNTPIELIQSLEEKIIVLQTTGIDYLIIIPFNIAFSQLSSLEFIEKILVEKIGCKKLVIGYDHHFGKNREGSFEYLKNNCGLYGFEVKEISAKKIDETKISSTAIRKYINEGNIEKVNQLLNYTYFISGKIIDGEKIGRTIGFPTANIAIHPDKLIPKIGVYLAKIEVDNKSFFGMLNIGIKPTFGKHVLGVEMHIFDFNEDIYNKTVKLLLYQRIRDEIAFNNVNELIDQLQKDKTICQNIMLQYC
jgi:riboflavin kinase/FMN adenylyltransferase